MNLETGQARPLAEMTAVPPLVVDDERAFARATSSTSAPTRELAQRFSGTDEVLLLWYPESERVELCVRDLTTEVSLHLPVAPGRALDAFYHPYAYTAGPATREEAGVSGPR